MDGRELSERTKRFAIRIVRLVSTLPKNRLGDVIGRQLLRSGTSIGANYREATRVTSRRHFASTISVVLREADETLYWLELLSDSGVIKRELLIDLIDECNQLVAIFAASVKTARRQQADKS
jgi:four helix bundle protein